MKRKFAVIFLMLFMFSMLTPVYAWSPVNRSGDWVICERTHWKKEGWNEGYAEWNEVVSNFNGYWIRVDTATWENWREWWQFGILSIGETTNEFYIKIKIETEKATLWVVTNFHGYTAWFGLVNGLQVLIGASISASKWDDVKVEQPSFDGYDWSIKNWNPTDLEIFIRNEGDKLKVYWFFYIPNQDRRYAVIKEFNQTLGTNANVTLIYEHRGQGKIEGYAYDSFTLPNFPPYELKGRGRGFLDIFTWLSSLDYYGIVSTLMVCVTIFFEFVKVSLPLLWFFALFWVLDCIVSAVVHGEPRIIGDMMMKIYDFLRGVWQTLVNIAQAIWDFITFWS